MTQGSPADRAATAMQHLEEILAALPVPTFVIDIDHRVVHWNRACEVVLHYPAAEMIGTRNQWKPFYPQERPVMADLVVSGKLELESGIDTYYNRKYRHSALIPGSYEAEDYFPNIGGGTWLYFTAAPLRDLDGTVVGAIETLQDVSSTHRANEALRREHQILNTIIEHFPSGITVIDDQMRVIMHNEAFLRLLDFPGTLFDKGAIPVEDVFRFNAERGEYGEVDVAEYVENAMARARHPETHCFERERPNGSVLEIRGTPLPVGGYVTSYTDITDRKRTEAELRRLLDEQRLIFDNAHVGIAWVRDRCILSCNMRLAEMFGFQDPAELQWESTRILYANEGQWQQIGRMYDELERSGSAQAEMGMMRRDGTPIWIMLTGRPINQDNVSDGSIWVYTDITERVLQQSQLALAERVFSHASEALMITDASGVIVNVNPAFTRITGYSREDAIGNTPRILKSERHDSAFYAKMWETVLAVGEWEGEIWDRRKDGSMYPKRLSITTVRDSAGQVMNFIGCFSDITERKAAEEKIQYLAHHDPLTSLPNRLLLRDRFNHALEHVRRSGRSMAFMFLDLDYFKRINDSLGHRVGDELLVAVVRRLRACVRESDTISRQGGDEFIVLLNDMEGPAATARIAEKMIEAIAQPFELQNHVLNTSVSIGIAFVPQDGTDFDALLQKSDTAMYASKERARGTFSFFQQSMDDLAKRRLELANSLRRALTAGEFRLVYQPQVFADTGSVFGAEALLRWMPKGKPPVPPAEFVPIAEEIGLILPLGQWVIAEACVQARRWRDTGLNCRVAVNVSGVQIQRDDIVATVVHAARDAGISPELIQIELTESTLIEDSVLMQDTIAGLKSIGASVAIDDFGTGYSSLAYLKRFRVDKLKIDRSFIADACRNEEDAAMSRAVISIARSLNIRSIAEGVETAEQLDFIRSAGCNEIQGYFYSHPLGADDFVSYALRSPTPAQKR